MITVTLMRNSSQELVGFSVSGHAGQAPKGQDIVCAAVSVLSLSTVNGLESQGVALEKAEVRDGYLMAVTAENQTSEGLLIRKALLETFAHSIQEIAVGDGASYLQIKSADEEVDSCFK